MVSVCQLLDEPLVCGGVATVPSAGCLVWGLAVDRAVRLLAGRCTGLSGRLSS